MNLNRQGQSTNQIIRVSLMWIFVGVIAMLLLGVVGGMLANQLWPTQRMPLTNEKKQIITTVQEVKISPNKAAAELVTEADRSIVGITTKNSSSNILIAAGAVVTNDGLIVTSAELPKSELVAIDWQGARIPLTLVGRDDLFGLYYLRIKDGLLSPLDVRAEEVPVGSELLIVSRAKTTGLVRADDYRVREWVLPTEIGPGGIQKLLKGGSIDSAVLPGSALIDDEMKLAGIVLNEQAGLILGGDHLLMSIQRIATKKREVDPLHEIGIKVHYSLEVNRQSGEREFLAEILSVEAKSWAASMGLKMQDKIRAIDDNKLDWQRSFVDQITKDSLKQITVLRGARDVVLSGK